MSLLTFASVISQKNTWSPLNVSLESFDQIVNAHSLSNNIYDVVQAFRHRRGEILQFKWSACRVQLGSPRFYYYGQSIAVYTDGCSHAHIFRRDLLQNTISNTQQS